MKAITRKTLPVFSLVLFILICLLPGFSKNLRAVTALNGSVVLGRVTDPQGRGLTGLFVSARNTATGRTTYVLTRAQGRFRVTDLEAGDFDIGVDTRGWGRERQQIKLAAGASATVNLNLKADPIDASKLTSAELLPLLPDGEGKQILIANCIACHTVQKFVTASWDTAGWRKIVNNMKKGFGASVPDGKDDLLVDYLSKAFAPDSSLQHAIEKIQLPPVKPMDVMYDAWDIPLRRALPHTVTLDGQGNAWFTDAFGSRMGRLEVATGKFKTWNTPTSNSIPHGIVVDKRGIVWFTERLQFEPANKIVRFDPQTEVFKEYPLPQNVSGPHTLTFDRQGILWISEYDGNRLARFDTETGKFTEYTVPTKDAKPYGIDIGKDGVVWIAEIGSGSLGKFDPRVGKVVDYPTPTKNSGVRRVRVDSKGRVWFTEFLGDRLGMFDPKTEKMTEYRMPGISPQPYALEITHDDKIWLSTWHQDSMMKFDPDTKTFTVYPVPFLDLEIRDFRIDKDDTLWFVAMIPNKVVSLKAR